MLSFVFFPCACKTHLELASIKLVVGTVAVLRTDFRFFFLSFLLQYIRKVSIVYRQIMHRGTSKGLLRILATSF